jgi:transcriptional regulator with XRE-family HTH domain
MTVLGSRLKEARVAAGISQERLGLDADLEPNSASTRVNRYELGKRVPDFELVERFAEVLNVPAAFFYCRDDATARLLVVFHRLSGAKRAKALAAVESI